MSEEYSAEQIVIALRECAANRGCTLCPLWSDEKKEVGATCIPMLKRKAADMIKELWREHEEK